MLSSMLYLNIHHELPRIGMDITKNTLDSGMYQPTSTGKYRAPRSTRGVVQSTLEIDTYPSRHAYGARTMKDFTAERGQQGMSDIKQSISRHTQQGLTNCNRAARKGTNVIHEKYKGELSAEVSKQRHIVAEAIPDPTITVHPAHVEGDMDSGSQKIEIHTEPRANVRYNPGRFRGYLEYKGTIQRWISRGDYDY